MGERRQRGAKFGPRDLQRSKSWSFDIFGAASCSGLIKLCKHGNDEVLSAPVSRFLPLTLQPAIDLHIIPPQSYHQAASLAPNDFKGRISSGGQKRAAIAAG